MNPYLTAPPNFTIELEGLFCLDFQIKPLNKTSDNRFMKLKLFRFAS